MMSGGMGRGERGSAETCPRLCVLQRPRSAYHALFTSRIHIIYIYIYITSRRARRVCCAAHRRSSAIKTARACRLLSSNTQWSSIKKAQQSIIRNQYSVELNHEQSIRPLCIACRARRVWHGGGNRPDGDPPPPTADGDPPYHQA